MRAKIIKSFAISGKTALVIELLEGSVKSGDIVICPLQSNETREVKVESVQFVDSLPNQKSNLVLLVNNLNPDNVFLGKELLSRLSQ